MVKKDSEVTFKYSSDYNPHGDRDEPITCSFILKLPSETKELIEMIKESNLIAGSTSKAHLKINEENKTFELKITGRRSDGRCTWCRTFRTRLRNLLKKEKIKLRQDHFCKFDQEDKYGLYLIEVLKKKIALYENGLDEENSEEDYESWKKELREEEAKEENEYRVFLSRGRIE